MTDRAATGMPPALPPEPAAPSWGGSGIPDPIATLFDPVAHPFTVTPSTPDSTNAAAESSGVSPWEALPSLEMPSLEMPSWEMPSWEMPSWDLPTLPSAAVAMETMAYGLGTVVMAIFDLVISLAVALFGSVLSLLEGAVAASWDLGWVLVEWLTSGLWQTAWALGEALTAWTMETTVSLAMSVTDLPSTAVSFTEDPLNASLGLMWAALIALGHLLLYLGSALMGLAGEGLLQALWLAAWPLGWLWEQTLGALVEILPFVTPPAEWVSVPMTLAGDGIAISLNYALWGLGSVITLGLQGFWLAIAWTLFGLGWGLYGLGLGLSMLLSPVFSLAGDGIGLGLTAAAPLLWSLALIFAGAACLAGLIYWRLNDLAPLRPAKTEDPPIDPDLAAWILTGKRPPPNRTAERAAEKSMGTPSGRETEYPPTPAAATNPPRPAAKTAPPHAAPLSPEPAFEALEAPSSLTFSMPMQDLTCRFHYHHEPASPEA